jgi:hypothetical protein
MKSIEPTKIDCPYCGEIIELLIDCSIEFQEYIEDCEVCCRPLNLTMQVSEDDDITVACRSENDC